MVRKKTMTIVGAIGAAIAAVGFFIWRRKRSGG